MLKTTSLKKEKHQFIDASCTTLFKTQHTHTHTYKQVTLFVFLILLHIFIDISVWLRRNTDHFLRYLCPEQTKFETTVTEHKSQT